ncbi:MAG: hypothetical protein AB1765_06580 [Candidatus Hydrogenedentota bacterium]
MLTSIKELLYIFYYMLSSNFLRTFLYVIFILSIRSNIIAQSLLFRVIFEDAYNAKHYETVVSSGMAIIAAPSKPFYLSLLDESKITDRANMSFALQENFIQNNAKVLRSDSTCIYLLAPDTGGTYSIIYGSVYSPLARIILVVPKKIKIKDGKINGYIMGNYPDRLKTPTRFIEITTELLDVPISSNLRFSDFVSGSLTLEQKNYFPKYVVIQYPIVFKIESLIRALSNHPQFNCKGIRVKSGYRTPIYNDAIPESVKESYHIYGLAVDIIVDANPRDGIFDDVNNNGKQDIGDAILLAKACDYLEEKGLMPVGGVGVYEYRTPIGKGKYTVSHFVHIDARGTKRARWGYWYRGTKRMGYIRWR